MLPIPWTQFAECLIKSGVTRFKSRVGFAKAESILRAGESLPALRRDGAGVGETRSGEGHFDMTP
jgi:hypothetical protein